jgi:hypothetical protein
MMRNIIRVCFFYLLIINTWALGLADFVPGFIEPKATESSDPNLPIKPLVNSKRNSSSGSGGSWYCNRTQGDVSNNVFCNNEVDTNGRVITYGNNANADKSKVVDITSNPAQTTANQSALLDQSTKNELDKSKNNFSLPIQPSKDVNMNVGQNQLDVTIKY